MTVKFPKENIWKQINIGDKFGDIWSSFNLDLTKKFGSVKVSPRFLVNVTTSDVSALDVAPFAILYIDDDSKWYAGSSAVTLIGDNLPSEAFSLFDSATGTPNWETTARPDMAYFNGLLYGMSAELQRLDDDSSDWDTITSLTGSQNGAPLIPFGATGRLYYRKGLDQMGSIDTGETPVAPTNTYALDLNDENQPISCGKASADYIWLGTIAQAGERARVHKWNGSSTAVTATYEIPAQAVLSMTIQNNVPWIFDSNGVLRYLNGGAFVEADRIPFEEGKPIRPLTGAHTTFMCHYNGMDSDKDNIYLNLNTTYADGTTDERCPSGVWIYNKRTGLHHYGSFGTTKSGGTITDYGGHKVSAIGAIRVAKVNDSSTNGALLAGATIFTSASATTSGIFYNDSNDTLQKAGTLVTSKIFSPNVKEQWQRLYVRLRKFLNSSDKIVVKYRTEEDEVDEGTITYASTTTFTSSDFGSAAVGDEVEIIQGLGAGRTAHITAINGTTYTIDETITGATTQTAKARVQSWKKIATFSNQIDEIAEFPISNEASAWIQFKIWALWTGDNEIFDGIVGHTANQKIE